MVNFLLFSRKLTMSVCDGFSYYFSCFFVIDFVTSEIKPSPL